MADISRNRFEAAVAQGRAGMSGPRARSVHHDAGRNRVVVRLTTGVEIGFAPQVAEGLQDASLAELRVIDLDSSGLGIHFPALDADLYVPALLEGLPGSERWTAADAASRRRVVARRGPA